MQTKVILSAVLRSSRDLTVRFQKDIPSLSAMLLMGRKQAYISGMVLMLPVSLFSEDVQRDFSILLDRLREYW
jgi:hypothetical protein